MQNLVTEFHTKYKLPQNLEDDVLLVGDAISPLDRQMVVVSREIQELEEAINEIHDLYHLAECEEDGSPMGAPDDPADVVACRLLARWRRNGEQCECDPTKHCAAGLAPKQLSS